MVEKFEAPQVCLPVPADVIRGNVVSLRGMARNTGRRVAAGGGDAVHRKSIGVIFSLCPWFVFFDSEFLNDILNDKLILHNDS